MLIVMWLSLWLWNVFGACGVPEVSGLWKHFQFNDRLFLLFSRPFIHCAIDGLLSGP